MLQYKWHENYVNYFVIFKDASETSKPLKKIFIFKKFHAWGWKMGRHSFVSNQCPVDTCELVDSMADPSQADAVFFLNAFPANATPWHRTPNQVALKFLLKFKISTKNIGVDFVLFRMSLLHATHKTSAWIQLDGDLQMGQWRGLSVRALGLLRPKRQEQATGLSSHKLRRKQN